MKTNGLVLFFILFFYVSSFGQKINSNFRLTAKKTQEVIRIDGELSEKTWQNAEVANDFFMITPVDTGKASQFSEVRMAYDEENIYLAVIFFNTTVKGNYTAESLKRDFSFGKNDNFLIAMDPFNNMTTGFSFGLNSYGAQWDGTMYNGGKVDLNWDTKWYSEIQFDGEKWVGEMAIPFKSIRYDEDSTHWGINFSRLDLKAGEKSSWAPVPRQFPSVTLAYTGIVEWETKLPKQGNNSSIIPYILANTQRNKTNNLKFGGDLKYGLTSSLNLDITANPDFSQTEVDQQVTNLSRFELFFPEKRQFFLENADLFSNFGYQSIRPFFSRRIGLDTPIDLGVRLSGNLNNNWRIGVMDLHTPKNEAEKITSKNYGVISLQRKVFDRSNIGLIFVNKQNLNNLEDSNSINDTSNYNRTFGIEYNHGSSNNLWNGKLLYLKSFSPQIENKNAVFASHLEYKSTRWNWKIQQEFIGENYTAEVGYIPRKGYMKIQTLVGHLFYTDQSKQLVSHGPLGSQTYFFNTQMEKTDKLGQLNYVFNFKDRSRLQFSYQNDYIQLSAPFDPVRTGLQLLEKGSIHQWDTFSIKYNSQPQSLLTYAVEGLAGGYYENGKRIGVLSEIGYRFQPFLSLNSIVQFNQITLPQPWGKNKFWLLGLKADLTLTNTIYFSNLFQYNEQLNLWNFNSRFQWRYQPASDIFLVFNSNEINYPEASKNWSLSLKLNYWLNF